MKEEKKVWQGVVYLPENSLSGNDFKTTLNFPFRYQKEGEPSPDKEEVHIEDAKIIRLFSENDIIKDKGEASVTNDLQSSNILRGKMYDVVAKIKNPDQNYLETVISIKDWDLFDIEMSLNGFYELRLESSRLILNSGVGSYLGYEASDDVEFISSIVDGKDLFLFEEISELDDNEEKEFFDNWKNYIKVSINPEVTYKKLLEIEDAYKYFYIKLGNLLKRIDITFGDIKPILQLNPSEIDINIGEILSSGEKSIDYDIEFITNLSVDSENQITIQGLEKLEEKGNISLTFEEKELINQSKLEKKPGIIKLTYTLTEEDKENKELQSYNLIFKCLAEEGQEIKFDFHINVSPYHSDYIIYFKSKEELLEWQSPHILIYEAVDSDNLFSLTQLSRGGYSEVSVPMTDYRDGWFSYNISELTNIDNCQIIFTKENKDLNSVLSGDIKDFVIIPMFDFPGKEGYVLYDSQKSVQTFKEGNPCRDISKEILKYRFYWKADDKRNLSFKINGSNIADNSKDYEEFDNNWFYLEFETEERSGDISYKIEGLYYEVNNSEIEIKNGLSLFSEVMEDGFRHGYVTEESKSIIVAGVPDTWEPSGPIILFNPEDEGWSNARDYEFKEVSTNTWKTNIVTIPANKEFMIKTVDGEIWGTNMKNDPLTTTTTGRALYKSSNYLFSNEDYTGVVTLTYSTSWGYTLYLRDF